LETSLLQLPAATVFRFVVRKLKNTLSLLGVHIGRHGTIPAGVHRCDRDESNNTDRPDNDISYDPAMIYAPVLVAQAPICVHEITRRHAMRQSLLRPVSHLSTKQ